jgi:hypothetical protein
MRKGGTATTAEVGHCSFVGVKQSEAGGKVNALNTFSYLM